MNNQSTISPAEYVGDAGHDAEGNLTIGIGDKTVTVNLSRAGLDPDGYPGWWKTRTVGFYVRRDSTDLSVIEVVMARHDGYAQEELDEANRQAEIFPLGPREYWRGEVVGKSTHGLDCRPMKDAEFEEDWADGADDEAANATETSGAP